MGSKRSGEGDGRTGEVSSYASLEKLVRTLFELQMASLQMTGTLRRTRRGRPDNRQTSFWDLNMGAPSVTVPRVPPVPEDTLKRALLRYKLEHDVAQASRAAASPKAKSTRAKLRGSPLPHKVQMKCGICDAYLGMTEYTVDARGVASVAVKSVCGDCLEEAMRRAAAEAASGSLPPTKVIAGGGKGDGQPRARLQIVRAVTPKKK